MCYVTSKQALKEVLKIYANLLDSKDPNCADVNRYIFKNILFLT
jgi:hypothetical protein